jgi:5'-deoxynucleotidase YfbR-like HD superfamily hydrolase
VNVLTEANLYREAADVVRYHTKRVHRSQSIGAHSFGIMLLLNQVAPDARKAVFVAAMHHDLPELITGDIPAPIKKMHDALGPLMDDIESGLAPLFRDCGLTPMEERLLKWADRMELVLWCLEEVRMGNTYLRETVAKGLMWILETPREGLPLAVQVLTNEVVQDVLSLNITVVVRPLKERENRA